MKVKRPVTQNAGAALERQAIMRKVRAMQADRKKHSDPQGYGVLNVLKMWIIGRVARNNIRRSGLGRKRK